MISIIIPYKLDDGFRDVNFKFTYNYYHKLFPDAEIIIGKDTSGEDCFCRSHSINDGVKKSTGDVLVLLDGDVLISKTALDQAINEIVEERFIIPWGKCIDISRQATNLLINNHNPPKEIIELNPIMIRDIRPGTSPGEPKSAGGLQIITRELYNENPYDNRMIGWGFEDALFCRQIKKKLGDYKIYPDVTIYHLYHPRPECNWDNYHLYNKLIKGELN